MNRRGAIVAEFALGATISAVILAGGAAALRAGVLRHRALAVADFAAQIEAAAVPPETVAAEIAAYAAAWLPGDGWRVTNGRFRDLPSASFYDFRFGRVEGHAGRWVIDERVVRLAERGGGA